MPDHHTTLERFFAAHTRLRTSDRDAPVRQRPFITISREAGAGGHAVGSRTVELLNRHSRDAPWTLFDRDLVGVVIERHGLPETVAKYMEERKHGAFEELVADLLGARPGADVLVRKTNATLVALAQMGNCILVGRGAHLATRKLASGFHVRLVASRSVRLERLRELEKLEGRSAAELLKEMDAGRTNYIRNAFDSDVSDPLAYDCLFNTTEMSFDEVARMLAAHVRAM